MAEKYDPHASGDDERGNATIESIVDEVVTRIVQEVHPLQIILFGSTARGELCAQSDVDLLVVMPDGTHKRRTAQKLYRTLRGLTLPVDVLVTREGEKLKIKEKIDPADTLNTREWLVRNVKGIGYKEASHFLRNIGLGKDLAILDVHILRNLKRYGVIKDPPKTLTRKNYLDVEEKMKEFSRDIGIPMDELDLLFWSRETGVIFK